MFVFFAILMLLSNSISKISNMVVARNSNSCFDRLNTSMLELYPILIPPDWVLQICLKDTVLLDELHVHINNCNNYLCMFSKVIEDESMTSIASIIRNDTISDDVSQKFKQSIQDCIVWWKLVKHFDKNANPRRELGRCLFQTFSFKCKMFVLDKVRILLITTEER